MRPAKSLLLMLVLAGCMAAPIKPQSDWTAGDHCRRSCDSEHARCGDQTAAQRNDDPFPGNLGVRGECGRNLKSCMDSCRAR